MADRRQAKGLGNKFLDDLRQAHALIHIVDASGSTDDEGNPVEIGSYDPLKDVAFLETEITYWLFGIIRTCFIPGRKADKRIWCQKSFGSIRFRYFYAFIPRIYETCSLCTYCRLANSLFYNEQVASEFCLS